VIERRDLHGDLVNGNCPSTFSCRKRQEITYHNNPLHLFLIKNFWTDCNGIQSFDFRIYLSHFELQKRAKVQGSNI